MKSLDHCCTPQDMAYGRAKYLMMTQPVHFARPAAFCEKCNILYIGRNDADDDGR